MIPDEIRVEVVEGQGVGQDYCYAICRPADGSPDYRVLDIRWQTGPIREGGVNGMQIEHVIEIARGRLERLNAIVPCNDNERAMFALGDALAELEGRRRERMSRGVEGTHHA